MASRAPKTAPRRPRELARRILDAFRTAPRPPRRLQDRPQRAQDISKAFQEPPGQLRVSPGRLQELSRRGFGAAKLPPRGKGFSFLSAGAVAFFCLRVPLPSGGTNHFTHPQFSRLCSLSIPSPAYPPQPKIKTGGSDCYATVPCCAPVA